MVERRGDYRRRLGHTRRVVRIEVAPSRSAGCPVILPVVNRLSVFKDGCHDAVHRDRRLAMPNLGRGGHTAVLATGQPDPGSVRPIVSCSLNSACAGGSVKEFRSDAVQDPRRCDANALKRQLRHMCGKAVEHV